jgi:outer membrane protein assembly factor BamB
MKLHEWNHIAITFDKGKTQIYANNQSTGDKTFKFTTLKEDSSPLYILTAKAAKGDTYAYYNLTGMLDNVRIYDHPLTAEEVAALYSEKKQE